MHSRPLEFDDLPRVTDLAAELSRSHRTLWANLRGTRRELERNPDFVTTLSIPETPDENTKVLHNLPQTEFDDTGFVGRERELTELRRALQGSYPVVTVVGEGGLGKTALALKACYDILDDNETNLDAIVWTTAKATKLTLNEIQLIEGAVSSSLGIIESATAILGRQANTDALHDLLMHLENNKILLVIDNLETVVDQNIRELVRRVPQGSRVLFTTRIGLGAFDFPVPLTPLAKKEAVFYFRRAARVWGVHDLATAANTVVESYCDKLQNNPLFIKWFIQSVRAGKRPSTLTSDPSILLQFCLQNVFNALSLEAKAVASTLASVTGSQSIASLAFYTDLDSINIQSALSVLITSNLVSAERGRTSEEEERYILSPLARMYIQKFIRPAVEQQKILIAKQNTLRSAQEEYAARAGADIFDINTVFIRDKDDYIVAKYLSRAIELMFKGRMDEAETQLEKAYDLSPNYFEVHRVRALLQANQHDFFSAEASYEAATSLAPDRAPLRLWYAGFLSRHLGDHERALTQLEKAGELSPEAHIVKLETARVLQYLRRFDKAREKLESVHDVEALGARTRRVHLDLCVQNELRRAEFEVSREDFKAALIAAERARNLLEAAPSSLIDHRTLRNVQRAHRSLIAIGRAFRGLEEESRVEAARKWFFNLSIASHEPAASFTGPSPVGILVEGIGDDAVEDAPPNRGRLAGLHENYGFIEAPGARLFFHRGTWKGRVDFTKLGEGAIVEFELGSNEKGKAAVNVRPISEELTQGQLFKGTIKFVTKTHGFITSDHGRDVFFHKTACIPGTRFNSLRAGERVRASFDVDSDGRKRAVNVELYSGL